MTDRSVIATEIEALSAAISALAIATTPEQDQPSLFQIEDVGSTDCRYPTLNGETSYRYNCRCPRCKRAHRDRRAPDPNCQHNGCVEPRVKHRRWCPNHIPPPKPSRVRSNADCEVCGQQHEWYESQLARLSPDLRNLKRRTCAACRFGYIARIKSHHLTADWAIRLIKATECELCAARFGIAERGTRRSCVDHDHDCCPGPTSCGGDHCIRGIICDRCNIWAGVLDNARRALGDLDRLLSYVDQHREVS